jgi:hypothetical protein
MAGFGTPSNSMMLCCRKAAESPLLPFMHLVASDVKGGFRTFVARSTKVRHS